VGVVGERDNHVRTGVHELLVQARDLLRVLEDDLRDERTGLQVQ